MHLLGQKMGMTHVYAEDGSVQPVTVVRVPKATVVTKQTTEPGKEMVQVGILETKENRLNKPRAGHLKKNGAKLYSKLYSFASAGEGFEPGQELTVETFEAGTRVDVVANTIGRGFTGGVKRWGFYGSGMSHGQSKNHRKPASGGATDAGRTFPGTRKPGQHGNQQRTTKNLQVVRVLPEDDLILIKGAVPGPEKGFVQLHKRAAEVTK